MSAGPVAAERERIARLIEDFDDFAYREVPCAGSVVDERLSMKKLATLVRRSWWSPEGTIYRRFDLNDLHHRPSTGERYRHKTTGLIADCRVSDDGTGRVLGFHNTEPDQVASVKEYDWDQFDRVME